MQRIPKIIHYCWFGGKEKPAKVQKCIDSWRRQCPDYKIIEWNESNFDISINPYAHEAYQAKYYAFCTDYVRLWAIHRYGGIYLDTDVELIKDITPLLSYDAFFATEDGKHVNTGLGFGATPRNSLVGNILSTYNNLHFIDPTNHRFDKMPSPMRNTATIKKTFPSLNLLQKNVINGIAFLPKDYFCPLDYETRKMQMTMNTYGIHWFDASWMSASDKIKKHLRKVKHFVTKHIALKNKATAD